MLHRTLVALLLVLLATSVLAGAVPVAPPVPVVLTASDEEVKKITEELTKAIAEKKADVIASKIAEMESLRHDSFVPFIRIGLKSAESAVVAASLRAAATHELKDVEKDAKRVLHAKPPKKDKDPTGLSGEVAAAAIDYLIRMGIDGEHETVIQGFLEPLIAPIDEKRVTAPWANDLLRASIHYLGKFKHKAGVPILVALIAVPQEKAATSTTRGEGAAPPTCPPEYWDGRNKLWQTGEGWVRWALKEITGQEFRSGREWEAWLKLNKKDYK